MTKRAMEPDEFMAKWHVIGKDGPTKWHQEMVSDLAAMLSEAERRGTSFPEIHSASPGNNGSRLREHEQRL